MQVDKKLAAQIEPFDSFWEAPKQIEKGYDKFSKFYHRNYLKHMPIQKTNRILVVSCGPGYFLDVLKNMGITDVLGIDSDPEKIAYARARRLNCEVANAFPFLEAGHDPYDVIFAEQEINHLTKTEIMQFLSLCQQNLKISGMLVIHSLNGANPITGSEAMAQNVNHFNTFTEYSLKQILEHAGFQDIHVFPLKLHIFYENPANYVGMAIDSALNLLFRLAFIFYGKTNKIFSKKIAAICYRGS